jgi:sRNA-binding protein
MPAKKKASTKGSATTKTATKKTATSKKPVTKMDSGSKRAATAMARAGDLIVIDSSKVGSPPREGEVLEVIKGEVRVSYRVRWPDGHESLIAPDSGSARLVPSRKR